MIEKGTEADASASDTDVGSYKLGGAVLALPKMSDILTDEPVPNRLNREFGKTVHIPKLPEKEVSSYKHFPPSYRRIDKFPNEYIKRNLMQFPKCPSKIIERIYDRPKLGTH